MFGALTRLAMLLGFEAGTLLWLLSLGRRPWLQIAWSDPGAWIKTAPPGDAIAALIWLAALGCVMWVGGSTLLYLAAGATRTPAFVRSVEWMTVPFIRRVTEGALAAMLVTPTIATVPVWADAPAPVVVAVGTDGTNLPPGISRPAEPATLPVAETDLPLWPVLPCEIAAGSEQESGPEELVVEVGDNLWILSRGYLTTVFGRRPSNREVAPYWRRVMARNQPNLISGNPDLIYPGEVIEMPPVG
jgi:hypothetical protein